MYLGMGIVKLTLLPNDLYFYFSIEVCLRGKLNYEDGKININCSCGYPSVQAKVEYKVYNKPFMMRLFVYFFYFFNYMLFFSQCQCFLYRRWTPALPYNTLKVLLKKLGFFLAGFFRVLKVKPFGEFRNLFCRLLLGILNQ